VILRRGLGPDAELKAFLSNAPADLPESTDSVRAIPDFAVLSVPCFGEPEWS